VTPTIVTNWLDLAVVGAHLEGMPLHPALMGCSARLQTRTTTAAAYRLFALAGGPPARPGLMRVADGGAPIQVEVYRLPRRQVGDLLATVEAPLAIGSIELASGEWVNGYVCEAVGLDDAEDITAFGGWRAYVAATRD